MKKNLRQKFVTRDQEGHFIIKESKHQEDIAIINIDKSKTKILQPMKQTLMELEGEINNS